MHRPFISYAFKYDLTKISAHGKTRGNIIKQMGDIFPGPVVNSEDRAPDKCEGQL